MANTKDYAMREMIIDKFLSTGGEYTRAELHALVNKHLVSRAMRPVSSMQTILNDINEMNEKFFRVYDKKCILYRDHHHKRYYRYSSEVKSIYNRELLPEEIEKINEVKTLLKGLHSTLAFDWIDEMMARFDQNIMGGDRMVVSFEDGSKKDAEFFMPLFNAITNKQAVRLVYQKFGAEPTERLVHPYFLKQYRRRWYTFVHDERREGIVCFALDRILSAVVQPDEPFVETDVDFNHYFDDIVGVTNYADGSVERVVLRVDPWVANYLQTSPIHPSQHITHDGQGEWTVTLDVKLNHELEQELLFYGEHVRVVVPEALREKMDLRISKMARNKV